MTEVYGTTELFRYMDSDGTILLEAPLLDLAHFIGLTMTDIKKDNPEIGNVELAQAQVEAINKKFGSNLSWGNVVDIAGHVNRRVMDLKKKTYSKEQELHTRMA